MIEAHRRADCYRLSIAQDGFHAMSSVVDDAISSKSGYGHTGDCQMIGGFDARSPSGGIFQSGPVGRVSLAPKSRLRRGKIPA
jgi:hypothetical protein